MRPIIATFLVWVIVVSAQQQAAPPRPQGQAAPRQGQVTAVGNSNQQQGAAAPGKPFEFKTSIQLVVLDLMIKDKSGNPVTGLTQKDFVVTEDGKPQEVSFAEFQKLEDTLIAAAPDEPAVLTTREEKAATDQPKSVTANEIAPEKPGDIKYKDKRLMVMFFDMTSMPCPISSVPRRPLRSS